MNNHDQETLDHVKETFKKGRMTLSEIEWLIVTLDYYLKFAEGILYTPETDKEALTCIH